MVWGLRGGKVIKICQLCQWPLSIRELCPSPPCARGRREEMGVEGAPRCHPPGDAHLSIPVPASRTPVLLAPPHFLLNKDLSLPEAFPKEKVCELNVQKRSRSGVRGPNPQREGKRP